MLSKKAEHDFKEAYKHARKALEDAEGKVEESRVSTLRRLVIEIADYILEYK